MASTDGTFCSLNGELCPFLFPLRKAFLEFLKCVTLLWQMWAMSLIDRISDVYWMNSPYIPFSPKRIFGKFILDLLWKSSSLFGDVVLHPPTQSQCQLCRQKYPPPPPHLCCPLWVWVSRVFASHENWTKNSSHNSCPWKKYEKYIYMIYSISLCLRSAVKIDIRLDARLFLHVSITHVNFFI